MCCEPQTREKRTFGQYLQPLRQIVNRGNVAMQWLEQHKRGASIAAIMAQSVISMREAEMLYAEHASLQGSAPKDRLNCNLE